MDPLTGLLGVVALSASSLAFLRYQKQQREGFEAVSSENYNGNVDQSQTVYNPLSQQLNPFANGLAGTNAQGKGQLTFGGVEANYDLNNSEMLNAAMGRYFSQARTEPNSGLIPTIQFCREQGKKADPFSDPRFAQQCGVCLTEGTDEEGNTFTGPRGLFVYEKEKEQAARNKEELGDLYVKAKPSLASCTGAPDQPVFAVNKDDLRRFQKRRECQTKKTVGDECGVCFQTQNYGYVEKQTNLETVFLVVAGQGKLSVRIDGTLIGSEDRDLSATAPLTINIGKKEGSRFVLTVKEVNDKALLYGFVMAQMANKGIFRIPLRRLVEKDEETGATPVTEPPSYTFPTTGVSSVKMRNANTKSSMRLTGILPFSFPSPGEFATLDCPSNPFQTQQSSLTAISDDPCAKRGASGYNDECLTDTIYAAGCTNGGTLAQTPSMANSYGTTLDAINTKLRQIKLNDGVLEEDSQLCSGQKPKTPCELALRNPNDPISTECLAYLYNNLGVSDARIGATYPGNEATGNQASLSSSLRYCLPSGTLSPIDAQGRPNTSAITLLNQKATQGFDNKKGIKAVQAFLNSILLQALDTTLPTTAPARADAIRQCFNTVASPTDPALAPSGTRPGDPALVSGNAPLFQDATATEVTGIRNSDDGTVSLSWDFDFFFMGTNYKNGSVYWNANGALGFGSLPNLVSSRSWPASTGRAILFGLRDGRTNTLFITPTRIVNAHGNTYTMKSLYLKAQNWWSDGIPNRMDLLIRVVRTSQKQFVEIRCAASPSTGGIWNISNGTTFLNTFGGLTNVAAGQSYVLESDATGSTWTFYPNYYLSF